MTRVIYDNIIFNLQLSGGISVYWKELIGRLIIENSIDSKFIEYEDAQKNIFRRKLKIDKDLLQIKKKFPSIKFRRYLNLIENCSQPTIFHSSYYRTMKGENVINVVTVHDFTYEKKMKSIVGKVHIKQKKNAIKNADGIICISGNTKNDLLEIYPEFKNKKIRVIYNGFNNQDYYPLNDVKVEDSVIFVGARNGYKNFKEVVEILSTLENISLKIIGSALEPEEITLLDKKIPNRYTQHNHISNEELNVLYNKSLCLVYLSDYEGFGIPVLEAMSAGCPVIALNKSSIPEVAGNAAILFDEIDYTSIRNAIIKLKDNKKFRDEQVIKGLANIERFSWDNCYEDVLKFYKELINDKG